MSGENEAASVHTTCPRCGYDLRGLIATWADACPLTGTCSECGLEFDWVEVFRPELFEPKWCVEYHPGRRWWLGGTIRTALRSFVPWRFFSELRMSHVPRWRRVFVYIILLFLPLLAPLVVTQAVLAVAVRARVEREFTDSWNALVENTKRTIAYLEAINAGADDEELLAIERTFDSEYALTIRYVRNQTPDQRAQFHQALVDHFSGQDPSLQPHAPAITLSYFEALIEAVLHPFATESHGWIKTDSQSLRYIAPAELWEYLTWENDSGNLFGTFGNRVTQWRTWRGRATLRERIGTYMPALLMIAGILLLMPLSFLLLPLSRRTAQVKWSHLARVGCYSVIILALAMYIIPLLSTQRSGVFWITHYRPNHLVYALLGGAWLATILWWAAAVRFHLRMANAVLVAVLLGVMNGMFLLALRYWYEVMISRGF